MRLRNASRATPAALAVLVGVALPGCGGASQAPRRPGPLPLPLPPQALFVAPSGADANPCSKALPCASFDRAYRLARPGDHVEVAGGTYPSQQINPDPTKKSPRDVVYRPAPGARVVIEHYLSPWASHVTVQDMVAKGDLFIVGERTTGIPQRDVTAVNIAAAGLQIDNASQVTIRGGSFGGTPERPTTWNSGVRRSTRTMPTDIEIDGASFHDMRCAPDQPYCHIECLIVGAVRGLSVRNSTFARCPIFDVFFEPFNGPIEGVRLEHNRFGRPTGPAGVGESAYAVQLKNCDCRYGSFHVRSNRFGGALGMGGDVADVPNSTVEDNVGSLVPYAGEARCGSPGIQYRDNRWTGGLTCGSTDRLAAVAPED